MRNNDCTDQLCYGKKVVLNFFTSVYDAFLFLKKVSVQNLNPIHHVHYFVGVIFSLAQWRLQSSHIGKDAS